MNARGQFYKVVLEDVLSQLCFKNLDCRIESVSSLVSSSMIERRKNKNIVPFPILITLSADFFIGNICSQIMSSENIEQLSSHAQTQGHIHGVLELVSY